MEIIRELSVFHVFLCEKADITIFCIRTFAAENAVIILGQWKRKEGVLHDVQCNGGQARRANILHWRDKSSIFFFL